MQAFSYILSKTLYLFLMNTLMKMMF